jgi:hypothetical protein
VPPTIPQDCAVGIEITINTIVVLAMRDCGGWLEKSARPERDGQSTAKRSGRLALFNLTEGGIKAAKDSPRRRRSGHRRGGGRRSGRRTPLLDQ